MKSDNKSTLFINIDSMTLRMAIPFCKERKMDLDSFIAQSIEDRMELMKLREREADDRE